MILVTMILVYTKIQTTKKYLLKNYIDLGESILFQTSKGKATQSILQRLLE